jgi:hypothetical protein
MVAVTLHTAPVSLLWYWINERHSIYLRRSRGEPKPWTDDDIFKDYKFTNVFRELDRGTVWLRENFLEPHRYPKHEPFCLALDDAPGIETTDCDCGARAELDAQIVGNVAWYRMFNLWTTGEYLGWQTEWDSRLIGHKLRIKQDIGHRIFTNAHIVWSEEGRSKMEAVVDYAAAVWDARYSIVFDARVTNSLEAIFNRLIRFRGIGNFIAYEIVTDLRHTHVLRRATDINTWANMGPGAKRGLQRLGMPCKNQAEGLASMRMLLDRVRTSETDRDGCAVMPEIVERIELRDIEHSLCELDKYCRVKFDEGKPRMTYPGRK